MGYVASLLLARWDRPLIELAANEQLNGHWDAEEEFSWSRADGWQCYAPNGFWIDFEHPGGELYVKPAHRRQYVAPPVVEIEAEIGGPVLTAGATNDYYRLTFIEGDQVRTVARGFLDPDRNEEYHEREMVERWGQDWPAAAAASLKRWAAPFVDVPLAGLTGALSLDQVFTYLCMYDVFRLLTLVPDPDEPPWWAKIPDAVWAIEPSDATDIRCYVDETADSPPNPLVLAYTADGIGIWDTSQRRWLADRSTDLDQQLELLRAELQTEYGWTPVVE